MLLEIIEKCRTGYITIEKYSNIFRTEYFVTIEQVNNALRQGEHEFAYKLYSSFKENYSIRKYNLMEAQMCLQDACTDSDLTKEITDWLINNSEEIKVIAKFPDNKRIISKVVFNCSLRYFTSHYLQRCK